MKKLMLMMLSLCLLAGCGRESAGETLRQLPVSVVENGPNGASNRHFSAGDLNGNYDGNLYYTFLQEVNVQIGEKSFPLEEAIRDGSITVEALVALAQADARAGLCKETSLTENGLTQFTYTYPDDFKMESINDILETPDGQQHRIQRLSFKTCSTVSDGLGTFLTDGGGPGDYLDKEDWGLTLSLLQVSPEGISIQCRQSGGQQFGQLSIWSYALYSTETDWFYETKRDSFSQPIAMDGATGISIDWSEDLSSLPAGSYGVRLRIEDLYSPQDVPPLSRNYHDRQSYDLAFTIE